VNPGLKRWLRANSLPIRHSAFEITQSPSGFA
jgi:hypothetical protein